MGPYGFEKDGRLRLEEYYPNAVEQTYKGVSGYIYHVDEIIDSGFELQIPDAATSSAAVEVSRVEWISDAYAEILKAEETGKIAIERFGDVSGKKKEWIKRTIREEFISASDHPDYQHFLKGKFSELLEMEDLTI